MKSSLIDKETEAYSLRLAYTHSKWHSLGRESISLITTLSTLVLTVVSILPKFLGAKKMPNENVLIMPLNKPIVSLLPSFLRIPLISFLGQGIFQSPLKYGSWAPSLIITTL